jgi:hypothetical protein
LAAMNREARTFSRQCCFVTATILLLAACSSESVTLPIQTGPVAFQVANDLIAPVTIKVDGSPYLILSGGRSAPVTVPANSRLTWTSAKPADTHGEMIPDEIGEQTVPVTSIRGTLEITNVIGSQTYFTARIFNFTSTRVSIGVFQESTLWCAALLPAETSGVPGFTLTGYYRLLPATELRAYTTSADCTGVYVPLASSQLMSLEEKSGLVTLSLGP